MSRTKYTTPFLPLEFSNADLTQLEQLSTMFVRKHVKLYERHLYEDKGVVDSQRWEFVTQRDNVCMYSERHKAQQMVLPVLIAVGTMEGELDDTMLGTCNPTVECMRLRTAHADDKLSDFAVLATLITPSVESPFRSMTVKWVEHNHPFQLLSTVKQRDYVFMESTGIEYLNNGERFGYHLIHSVQFPQTPELAAYTRGNMSLCTIFRQKSNSIVDVFLKVVLGPESDLLRKLVINVAAASFVTLVKLPLVGQKKKLSWMISQRSHTQQSLATEQLLETCGTCQKSLSASLLRGFRSNRCKICGVSLCGSCKVKKKLALLDETGSMTKSKVVFCTSCLIKAENTKAVDIAREQIVWRQHMQRELV